MALALTPGASANGEETEPKTQSSEPLLWASKHPAPCASVSIAASPGGGAGWTSVDTSSATSRPKEQESPPAQRH